MLHELYQSNPQHKNGQKDNDRIKKFIVHPQPSKRHKNHDITNDIEKKMIERNKRTRKMLNSPERG